MQKIAIVTGASGDIGVAIVEKFVKNGYFVIGQYFSNDEIIKKFATGEFSGKTAFFACDFSDPSNAGTLAHEILSAYPTADCLIHAAGISHVSPFQDETNEQLKKLFCVNLISPMAFTREIIPGMISAKKGAILSVSSIWGKYGGSCEVAYSATKGGMNAFTKALSRELGLSNIRVNALSCGFIETKMTSGYTKEEKDAFKDTLSLAQLGTPDDVAEAALFLCSDKAKYITGQILGVDGGF